jgi:Fic family protein
VVTLIDEFVTWAETGDLTAHHAVRAAMAHLHVASIHPFRDGNGRVARIVQALVLGRSGVLAPELASIEPVLARDTEAYYLALQHAQGESYDPSRDATDWIVFCIRAHLEQARRFQEHARELATRWTRLEALVAARAWPDRLVIALEHALTTGLSRAAYAAEAGIAAPTATLDLRRLVDAGFIEPRGSGRSTTYTVSEQLRVEVVDALRGD